MRGFDRLDANTIPAVSNQADVLQNPDLPLIGRWYERPGPMPRTMDTPTCRASKSRHHLPCETNSSFGYWGAWRSAGDAHHVLRASDQHRNNNVVCSTACRREPGASHFFDLR